MELGEEKGCKVFVEEGNSMLRPKEEYVGVKSCDDDDVLYHTVEDADEDNIAYTGFEDALDDGDQPREITVSYNGKQMYKASALRLISTSQGLQKSNDRLRRVAGLSKFMSKLVEVPDESPSNQNSRFKSQESRVKII